jgi:CRP-like cAMP-binding protein
MPTPHQLSGPNKLLAAFPAEDIAALEPHLETIDLSSGRVLYECGQTIRHAYFPLNCVVSLVAVLEDGRSAEVALFGCEGVTGLPSSFVTRESFGRYVVQIPGRASRIAMDRLEDILDESPAVRDLVRNYVEALLQQTFQTVACNALHNVEARCCRWILSTHDRMDGDTLALTHEFLAEMLGVQRSTITAVTRPLQTTGLIRQSRGGITVTDRAGLEDAACECYGTTRRIFERYLPNTYSSGMGRDRVSMQASSADKL